MNKVIRDGKVAVLYSPAFRVNEYDGSESIETLDDLVHTA